MCCQIFIGTKACFMLFIRSHSNLIFSQKNTYVYYFSDVTGVCSCCCVSGVSSAEMELNSDVILMGIN